MAEQWNARVFMTMCEPVPMGGEKSRLVSSDTAALARSTTAKTGAQAKRDHHPPSSSYLYNLAMVDFGE